MIGRSGIVLFATLWLSAGPALGNWITRWWGDPSKVSVNQNDAIVTINGSGDFGFRAETYQGSGELGMIDEITVAPGVTGTVGLYIQCDQNDPNDGARYVGMIDLRNAWTSIIRGVHVSEDLGDPNKPIGVAGDAIAGEFTIGRNILHDIEIAELLGNVFCHGMKDFTATGGPTGRHTGRITLADGTPGRSGHADYTSSQHI
jgi:hypothetical protein